MIIRQNQGIYLYNGLLGVIGVVISLYILSILLDHTKDFLFFLFPVDDFKHVYGVGDAHLVAFQHGLIYKPYISIPLFMFFLWFSTNGGKLFYSATELMIEDLENDTGPLAKVALALASLSRLALVAVWAASMWWVVTIPILAILPYDNAFAEFLAAICLLTAAVGILGALPFVLFHWRLIFASIGVVKGNQAAQAFFRERDAKHDDAPPNQDTTRAQEAPNMADDDEDDQATSPGGWFSRLMNHMQKSQQHQVNIAVSGVRGIEDAKQLYLRENTVSDDKKPKQGQILPPEPIFRDDPPPMDTRLQKRNIPSSYVDRMKTRAQTKAVQADAELNSSIAENLEAKKKAVDAHVEFGRSTTRAQNMGTIIEGDNLGRDTELRELQIKNAEIKARQLEQERALLAAQKEALQAAQAPPEPEPVSEPQDPFDAEIDKEFELSKGEAIRMKAEMKIMKILNGLPEENATAPMKAHFAKIREKAQQMAKDVDG